MEILVALVLISLVFLIIPTRSDERDRTAIETAANELDRATRYAQDEAILRNVVTRIKIDLTKTPQEYVVEYGPSGNIPLPAPVDYGRLSLREKEEEVKKEKLFNNQFTKTEEFSEKPKKFSELLRVLGVSTTYHKEIIDYEDANIYFYPTGEKDSALIIFGTDSEMATLSIEAFQQETQLNFYSYTNDELHNLQDSQENKMKEIVQEWKKE